MTRSRRDPIDPPEGAQSANLLQIVAVFYAVVLGQSLITKYEIVLHPGKPSYAVAGLTLLLVFSGAAWEFLRLSNNIERYPYDVKWVKGQDNRSGSEELRFGLDLLTAAGFAVLLIEAFDLEGRESTSIVPVLAILLTVNGLSYVSTCVMEWHWWTRKRNTVLKGLVRYATPLAWWPAILLASYWALDDNVFGFREHRSGWNVLFLAGAVAVLNLWELLERKAVRDAFMVPSKDDAVPPGDQGASDGDKAGVTPAAEPSSDYDREPTTTVRDPTKSTREALAVPPLLWITAIFAALDVGWLLRGSEHIGTGQVVALLVLPFGCLIVFLLLQLRGRIGELSREGRKFFVITTALALVLFGLSTGFAFWFGLHTPPARTVYVVRPPPGPHGLKVLVPMVVNMGELAAISSLLKAGFVIEVTKVPSPGPHGQVLAQAPNAGATVSAGSVVTLDVSGFGHKGAHRIYGRHFAG